MKIFPLAFVLSWFMLTCVFDWRTDAMAQTQRGDEKVPPSFERIQGGGKAGTESMRIEEPDGTLRPLPPAPTSQSRLTTEGIEEVPDAGGGTMVNVEGRFQSILQVPEGSDQAIHGNAHEEPQQSKP
jgi:hypothetical protein